MVLIILNWLHVRLTVTFNALGTIPVPFVSVNGISNAELYIETFNSVICIIKISGLCSGASIDQQKLCNMVCGADSK